MQREKQAESRTLSLVKQRCDSAGPAGARPSGLTSRTARKAGEIGATAGEQLDKHRQGGRAGSGQSVAGRPPGRLAARVEQQSLQPQHLVQQHEQAVCWCEPRCRKTLLSTDRLG